MKLNLSVLAVFVIANTGLGQFTCLKGDCQNGYGEAVFPSGAKYAGEFRNGRLHGLGTMYFPEGHRYSGYWKNQYREGQGRFTFASGDEYLGAFLHNNMEGKGVMTYANGNVYKGEWKSNQPHGLGELDMLSGARYTGYFAFGNFEGEGVMRYADGSTYSGMWKKGMRCGYGKLVLSNGSVQETFWENNMPLEAVAIKQAERYPADSAMSRNCNVEYCASGLGRYVYRSGNVYVGTFRNGIPEGEGKVFYSSGDRYEGGWLNHQPQGKGTMFYASGNILRSFWIGGKPLQFPAENSVPSAGIGTSPYATPAVAKVHAVIVGVAQYPHYPALRYTDDDAYRLYAFLMSPEGGAIPDEQMVVLIDEDATRDNILRHMRDLFGKAGPNDLVLLYFSGHGLQGSFLPIDYDGHNNQLFHSDIKRLLDASAAKYQLILADACHSGSLLASRGRQPEETLSKYYETLARSKSGTALIMSSKSEETSLESGSLRQGVFSHFLIRGLKGQANTDGDGIVSVQELFQFVYENVRSYTRNQQSPVLEGNYDPKMPVSSVVR